MFFEEPQLPSNVTFAQGVPPLTPWEQLLVVLPYVAGFISLVLIGLACFTWFRIGWNKAEELQFPHVTLLFSGLVTLVAFASLIAIFPLPYDYYLALRVLVFTAAALLAWHLIKSPQKWLVPALAITALLYNPFVPAQLTKEIWMVLNLLSAILFGFVAWQALQRT